MGILKYGINDTIPLNDLFKFLENPDKQWVELTTYKTGRQTIKSILTKPMLLKIIRINIVLKDSNNNIKQNRILVGHY